MWTTHAQQVDNSELHPTNGTTRLQDVVSVLNLVSHRFVTPQGKA